MNLFSDATVSAESLLRICGEDMLPMDTRTYEFHRSGISLLASAGTANADADADARVYTVQMEDPSKNIAARLVMWRTDATASTTASYIGGAGSGWSLLKYICSDAGQDQREWDEVESHDIQPPFIALILGGWRFLEEGASNRKRTAETISAAEIRGLLALPICQPYDDYGDGDRCGLWVGHCHAAFRQEKRGPGSEGPMLRLSRELQQTDGSSVTESYYYYVETCMDGRERVHIRYKADLRTEDSPVQIDPVGGEALADALQLFKRGAREMHGTNSGLLKGRTPYFAKDHALAVNFWKQQGYLPE